MNLLDFWDFLIELFNWSCDKHVARAKDIWGRGEGNHSIRLGRPEIHHEGDSSDDGSNEVNRDNHTMLLEEIILSGFISVEWTGNESLDIEEGNKALKEIQEDEIES